VIALRQSTPNPFVERATIAFDLPEASHVTLGIYDLQGRLIRRLVDRPYGPGRWSATWDRTDDAGKRVTNGVYFYRAELGTFVSQKKMLLVR
jgi:flagellar hook assembly protein FlgD